MDKKEKYFDKCSKKIKMIQKKEPYSDFYTELDKTTFLKKYNYQLKRNYPSHFTKEFARIRDWTKSSKIKDFLQNMWKKHNINLVSIDYDILDPTTKKAYISLYENYYEKHRYVKLNRIYRKLEKLKKKKIILILMLQLKINSTNTSKIIRAGLKGKYNEEQKKIEREIKYLKIKLGIYPKQVYNILGSSNV